MSVILGATEMFISEIEKEENLWDVMPGSYQNRVAKNKGFDRLSELLGLLVGKEFRK